MCSFESKIKYNIDNYTINVNIEIDNDIIYDTELNKCRNLISKIPLDKWKTIRWIINEYDFPVKGDIINRAFYKYWEIINEYKIFEMFTKDDIILHCAEAPGGFIQGTHKYFNYFKSTSVDNENLKKNLVDDFGWSFPKSKKIQKKTTKKIYTISMTERNGQGNLPIYNKNIITKYTKILYGSDNTGDINNLDNILHICKEIPKKCFLVTGDGGFDECGEYNKKEPLHYSLILNEILTALCTQQKNGHFILKIFDIYTETMKHLLFLLKCSYKEFYIYKPLTSRPTNSEKYVICKYFNGVSDNIIEHLKLLSIRLYDTDKEPLTQTDKLLYKFTIFDKIPDSFLEYIDNINTKLSDIQCEFIKKGLIYNEHNKLSKTNHSVFFEKWCKKFKLN